MNGKIKILYLSASPDDQHKLSVDEEFRAIYEKVDRDSFEIISDSGTRAAGIQSTIVSVKPEIVHFSGHGSSDELLFENEAKESLGVPKSAIVNFFENLNKKPRLVFFNACQTAENLERLSRIIDFVVVTLCPVFDEAARLFATKFYEFLSLGESVQAAFNHAQNESAMLSIQQTDEPGFDFAENAVGSEGAQAETKVYRLFIRDGVSGDTVFKAHSDKSDENEEKKNNGNQMNVSGNTIGKFVSVVDSEFGDINL